MPLLKKFERKRFTEIYLLSGEIVTIFKCGIYNYRDTRRPDVWICGVVKLKKEGVDFGPISPPYAVKEAFEILGYTIKV